MKTIKFLTTMSAVAIVAIATAVEKPKMDVTPLTADRAVVSITNEKPAFFEVSIKTFKGDLVYYKKSSEPITDYQKTFDFTNLENGNYVLNLRVNDTELAKDLKVFSNQISVGESILKIDPYFSFNDNVLKISLLNVDKQNFNINIYSNGDLIYKKRLGNDFSLQSGFDLAKLDKGNYEVVLSGYNNEYVYSLVK
ncbi:MAG: hypothetical protein R2757_07670 [Draconibacterium sp.]